MNMRFGTWNVKRLYSAGSLVIVSKKTMNGSDTELAGEYTFFLQKGE
jgi:hypothetical protein